MDVIDILKNKKGFVAALDQSGGSSKKTLLNYGVTLDDNASSEEMFEKIHEMRSRIITNPEFNSDKILAAIIFEDTMHRFIDGVNTVKYLENKGILSFLKIDVGLEEESDGVKLLKEIPNLENRLDEAKSMGVIGTKMRSVIYEYNEYGIKKIIDEQFRLACIIINHGLVPIIEPEVDINAQNKKQIESFMRGEIINHLRKMNSSDYVIFKFTLPEVPNYYRELMHFKNVLRIVALSGGYPLNDALIKLSSNNGMIASFSRALLEPLNVEQTDQEFSSILKDTISKIYDASTD